MSLQVSAALESKHVAPDLMCKLAVADDDYTHHDIKDAGYVNCADIVEIFTGSFRVFCLTRCVSKFNQIGLWFLNQYTLKNPPHSTIRFVSVLFDADLVISALS